MRRQYVLQFDPATGLLTYNFGVTVTNSGFGPIFDIVVTDTPQGQAAQTFNFATLAAGASHTFNGNFTQVPSLQMPNPPTNVATVEAAATAGGAKILHGTSNTATCPQVQFDASLTVTKSCTSRVEVQSNRVVVAIDFTGTACNVAPDPASGEFPSPIDNVTITDDPAAAGGVINLGTLATGECKNYTATYYPSTIVGTGNPHDQTYTDTVTVAGTARFTGAAKANTASANCPLCP